MTIKHRSSPHLNYKWQSDSYDGISWQRFLMGTLYKASDEYIDYQDGPKYVDFHSNWKRCSHMKSYVASGLAATIRSYVPRTWPVYTEVEQHCPISFVPSLKPESISGVNNHVTNTAVALLQDKFDLNCKDRVLGYSYALDLIPYLGAFLKASSVLNRIGRWAAKRGRAYRDRPFTTVIYDAMRADLINRFVIQTTIAETRQILTVYERCTRAWEQAHLRNTGWTTLTAQATTSKIIETGQSSVKSTKDNLDWPRAVWGWDHIIGVTSKVHAVLRLEYDIAKADPVKWVARALGITTPLESAWDKIPFSFVCDYFFRVGELIEYISDKDTSQDGLVGKVCDIAHVWATSESRDAYETIRNSGYVTPGASYTRLLKVEFSDSCYQTSEFYRGPIDMSDSSGFWDKGGFWRPRLSSTRKRTLLEMVLLRIK